MSVLPFHPTTPLPAPDTDATRADALQWDEARDAMIIADSVALLRFGVRSAELCPPHAALCRRVGAHALRALHNGWTRAADTHAVNSCEELLKTTALDGLPLAERARMLTAVVLAAYHDIIEGALALPDDLYLTISRDDE